MKYIIEIEEEPCMYEYGIKFYQCKNVPYWSISDRNISKLEPYTDPDRKAIEDEVWEFVKKIECLTIGETEDCFDVEYEGIPFVANMFSYQEAKSKYESWKKQKDEIHVGDEVLPSDTEFDTMVVTRIWKDDYDSDCVDTIGYDGRIYSFLENRVLKTGRHFDEVAELLQKMRGEQDE